MRRFEKREELTETYGGETRGERGRLLRVSGGRTAQREAPSVGKPNAKKVNGPGKKEKQNPSPDDRRFPLSAGTLLSENQERPEMLNRGKKCLL